MSGESEELRSNLTVRIENIENAGIDLSFSGSSNSAGEDEEERGGSSTRIPEVESDAEIQDYNQHSAPTAEDHTQLHDSSNGEGSFDFSHWEGSGLENGAYRCNTATEWEHLGARPKERPLLKKVPERGPQQVREPVACGLSKGHQARHPKNIHDSLDQDSDLFRSDFALGQHAEGEQVESSSASPVEKTTLKTYSDMTRDLERSNQEEIEWKKKLRPIKAKNKQLQVELGWFLLESKKDGTERVIQSSRSCVDEQNRLQNRSFAEKSTQTNFILPEQSVPAEPTGSVIAGMDSSLPGASYVEPMLNLILRAEPCMMSCQAAARPDERNCLRFLLPLTASMGENAVGVVGGPNEMLNAGLVQPRLVPSSTRSNGADTGLLSEMGSSGESHFAPAGNASSNLLSTPGDQAASEAAAEPCRAVDPCFNSEDSMLDRDSSTDSADATMNATLLTLAQRIQQACAHIEQREEQIREREEWERGNRGLQGQVVGSNFEPAVDFTAESLDAVHSTASAFQQGVARARDFARREEVNRRWCTCAQPDGDMQPICRQCFKHRYLGPSSPSGHEVQICCFCQQDSSSSCHYLPCAHMIHTECVITMLRNGIIDCPICCHPFLGRR